MSVLVVGGGGHAKVVIATLHALGHVAAGVLDDDPATEGASVLGVPVVGSTDRLRTHVGPAVLAVGSNGVRQRLAETYADTEWLSLVHPRATVHSSVHLGLGTVVFAGAVVQPDVTVGQHVVVNTGATVDHDGHIDDFAHLAPGVHLSGGVTVGEGALLGVGACVAPGITVGAWGVVGAGAAVVRDLPPNVTSIGVPAVPIVRT